MNENRVEQDMDRQNKEEPIIRVSPLGKTWILDLDGTIVKHNGYKIDGKDTFLPGAKEFLDSIPDTDQIIFLTSRKDTLEEGQTRTAKQLTEEFLKENHIRYDHIIWNAPYGERILINDSKPSGLPMAYAVCPKRDEFFEEKFEVDESL